MENPIRTFGRRKIQFARSEWKIFFWCFVVATFLWFLIVLNETYTSTINVQAHYYNVPARVVFVHPLPTDFKIAVNAKGWDLLAYSISGRAEDIHVDLKEFDNQPYILTRRLKVNVQQQLSQKITVNDIYPDTISLAAARKMVKKVPVSLKLDITYEKQFDLGGEISYSPDSVIVSGPAGYVKNIKEIATEPLSLKGLKEETITSVRLRRPEQTNIRFSVPEIRVRIPVYQLTEGSFDIPVEIVNSKIQGLKLIPAKVKVTFQTTLNQFKNIDQNTFQAIVDGSNIDTMQQQPLKVQFISQPKYIHNLRLNPEYVNYVIRQ